MAKKNGNWSLEDVAGQAVVLYDNLRRGAVADADVQGENFWEGHRNTALYALRGNATPITEEEVSKFLDDWNKRPQRAR